MAQQLRAHVLLEDRGFISSSHIVFSTICNSSFRTSDALLWPLASVGTSHACGTQTYMQAKHPKHEVKRGYPSVVARKLWGIVMNTPDTPAMMI